MAICDYCKGEMLTVSDCAENRVVEYPDGEKLNATPSQGAIWTRP